MMRTALQAAPAGISRWLVFALAMAWSNLASAQRAHLANAQLEKAATEVLIAELDARFAQGDIAGYLAHFEAGDRGIVAMLQKHLADWFARSARRERKSNILTEPRHIGGCTLMRVRHRIDWTPVDAPATDATRQHSTVEDTFLAVQFDADDRALLTFVVPMPAAVDCVPSDRFQCRACNYAIGGTDGWLCVPQTRARALALEAASFYLIGTSVVCDVSVNVEPRPIDAGMVAHKLATKFAAAAATDAKTLAEVRIPEPWVPPDLIPTLPDGMQAIRLVVDLPDDRRDAGGLRAIFHVVTLGGLQHILLLRGSNDDLRDHRDRIDALFASYTVLETDCDLAAVAALPLRIHTGGFLTGTDYENETYRVELAGPNGWSAELRAGGHTFSARWAGPDGGRLWLFGNVVPEGFEKWTEAHADCWIEHRYKQMGLEQTAESRQSVEARWCDAPDGARCRTIVVQADQRHSPAAPLRRLLQMRLHDDLLMIVDLHGGTAADEQIMRTAAATLRRK